ncbi:MAG TPA: GAF domain-containing sensor histidine kinase, partial [Deinococcales bacterium]|nr:GAF domain-containing sensor histidine kinase [Deinococcales bacterium]
IEAAGGSPDLVLVFAVDVTPAVRARREVERLNLELESRVAERTSELEARNRALEAFAVLARDLASESDPERITGRALQVISQLLPVTVAGAFTPERDHWKATGVLGNVPVPDLNAAVQAGLPFSTTPVMMQVLSSGNASYQERLVPAREAWRDPSLGGASACLPVLVGGRPAGVLVVVQATRRDWTLADRAALETAAVSLGQALERAEATGELARARARADALARLANELQGAGSLAEAGAIAFEHLSKMLRGHRLFLAVVQGDRLHVQGAWGAVTPGLHAALDAGLTLDSPSVSSLAARTGRAHYTHDIRPAMLARDDLSPEFVQEAGAVALAAEPFTIAGCTYVLTLGRPVGEGSWTPVELEFFARAALTFSVALARVQAEEKNRAGREELEARNAEQETFVYTVSHDLRAPLLAIAGMSELLNEAVQSGDKEETAFLFSRVQANVDKMQQLLTDLLNLSRAGRKMEEPERLELGEVLNTVLNDLQPLILARGATVETPAHLPAVRYGRTDAYQVLTNLISNAIKYGGANGARPRVTVNAAPPGPGGLIALTVDDNGPGIPERYRERVFALFQRLSQDGEGTGVGLSIVRRIAERNGGSASVTDAPGGGARLTVTLPTA